MRKVGFCAALVAFAGAAGYSIVQILQIAGLLHRPWDDFLIYGTSLLIAAPFMVAMLAFYYTRREEKRFWSHAAVLFSLMYATFATLMYVVQLTAVLPYKVSNPALTVYPHSLFWTVDSLAYVCMGLATLFAAPSFEPTRVERWARGFFLANAIMTPIVATVYYYPTFSIPLLLLASPWIVTASGSTLLLALVLDKAA